ncbi:hypothetical protein ACUXIL_003982 [Ralstonia pickettii]
MQKVLPPAVSIADSLRLAIPVLRDVAKSGKLPSGAELANAPAVLHSNAADTPDMSLADLKAREYESLNCARHLPSHRTAISRAP